MFNITERFYSIQGEGRHTGASSLFIRLAKCNLRCSFCDSKYSWSEGTDMTEDEILKLIEIHQPESIVFTGGEPLLQRESIKTFMRNNYSFLLDNKVQRVEVETNGTLFPELGLVGLPIHFNVSPKLSNSNIELFDRYKPDVLRFLNEFRNTTFKFVCSDKQSEKEILQLVKDIGILPENVYIMPEGQTIEEINRRVQKTVDFCLKYNFRFCHRNHILIWNNKRGV